MRQTLGFEMRPSQELHLAIAGGYGGSLFPRTERALETKSIYQKALTMLATPEELDGYRSIVDFLFCETFPEWKTRARAFYDEEGPALRDCQEINPPMLQACDWVMVHGTLQLAAIAYRSKREHSWEQIAAQARILVAGR